MELEKRDSGDALESRPNVWQLQSRRDEAALIAALGFPDPEVRKRAAIALRSLDAIHSVPALKAALRAETDPQTRQHIAAALHGLDHRTDVGILIRSHDVDGLLRALRSRRQTTVTMAARALGQLGDKMAVEPLVMLFQNPAAPPKVRLAAADALLELQSAPAVVTLLGGLRRDSWRVRRNAAAVLGQIQAIWAVEPLSEALYDPHPVVQRTAAAALRRIGTAEAIAALRARFAVEAKRQKAESLATTPAAPARPAKTYVPSEPGAKARTTQTRPPQKDVPPPPPTSLPEMPFDDSVIDPLREKRPEETSPPPATLAASPVVDTQPLPPKLLPESRERRPVALHDSESSTLLARSLRRIVDKLKHRRSADLPDS